MKKDYTLVLFCILGLLTSSALAQINRDDKQVSALYREALALFNYPKPTSRTDSLAFSKLTYVTNIAKQERKNALILFDCYEKAGIIKQTYGSQQQAIVFYKKAIACCFAYKLPDSLLFKPYLYCGSAYYFTNLFDSSLYYLKKSEAVLLRFPVEQEAQRLYNSFGALYYEAGNYQQSVNYFRKAVQVNLKNENSNKAILMYGYKSNIASALRKMEQYNSAVSMYKSLIPLSINRNDVFINLGTIYLEKNKPDSALIYLSRINNADNHNHIVLENALGNAYLQKKDLYKAFTHLNKALDLHRQDQTGHAPLRRPLNIGITYKLLADAEYQRHNLYAALRHYQQSIIQLNYAFKDSIIYHNPPTVTGGFRNYSLFESLAAKANCLSTLCNEQPTNRNRSGTIETYKAALKLADYIEKSFDTEDAQLFTVRKVFPVYQEAVTFMVRSFEQTNNEAYLEEAFRWAEKSKAVALYINLKENEIKSSATIPDSLLRKERELKFNLSRLLIKIDKAVNNQQTTELTSEMRDNELALSRLANKLLDYPDYRRQKFTFESINVPYLKRNLLRQHTAIISYFQASDVIYCFVLTGSRIRYYKSTKDAAYYQALRTISSQLRTLTPGLAYQGHRNARFLYDRLIKPAEQDLQDVSSLLIIPQNDLSLLPFDILESSNDTYLLEKFDITYQYAASFLQYGNKGRVDFHNTLAMAPFDSVELGDGVKFDRLPASDKEIESLKGIRLRYRKATKENFLKFSENTSEIHLATHAVANSDYPSRSYIAFYAEDSEEGKLYAHELYNARLADVHLIFLSACETASGKLISGEGVMSLSRGFSAAGCSNIVTSLWKAEDEATAYISTKFYAYLKQGYNSPQALQQAKLDLLHDGRYAQFHSPQYWAHLLFYRYPGRSVYPLERVDFSTFRATTYWRSIGLVLQNKKKDFTFINI